MTSNDLMKPSGESSSAGPFSDSEQDNYCTDISDEKIFGIFVADKCLFLSIGSHILFLIATGYNLSLKDNSF